MKPSSLTVMAMAILCLFASCYHENFVDPSTYSSAAIGGRVINESDVPLEKASVELGSSAALTDVNGEFKIRDQYLNKNGAVIRVNKAGYFTGIRTVIPSFTSTNNIQLKLIRKIPAGNFAASSCGTINVPSGGSIIFPANSLVNASNGVAYHGTAVVSAFFIDPTTGDFQKVLPGDLRGIDVNNKEVGLQSMGMMTIEIDGASGEKLQLAKGKQATITFPIPSSLIQQAQATIPLWYLDETSGIWKEEGTANKQGNTFVGHVSHFTTWNCDYPYETIEFTATVVSPQGDPMSGIFVNAVGANGSTGIWSNIDGTVDATMPANQRVKLILSGTCSGDTIECGPFSSKHDFGILHTKAVNGGVTFVMSGRVKNCQGNNVTDGYVTILLGSEYYAAAINNGKFSFTTIRCSADPIPAQLVAWDNKTLRRTDTLNTVITAGNRNVGDMSACVAPDEYIDYSVGGGQVYRFDPAYGPTSAVVLLGRTRISLSYSDSGFHQFNPFDLRFMGNSAGTHQISYLKIAGPGSDLIKPDETFMNVVISEFGGNNQYIVGSFSGIVRNTSSQTDSPIDCSFRIRRKN